MTRLSRAADRLATGSRTCARRLGTRAAAWCARGRRDDLNGWRAVLGIFARLALLALGVYLLARLVRALPSLMWLLTGWWTVAAWRAGKTTAEPAEDEHAEATAAPSSRDVRGATLEWIWRQIGDRQAVHLRDLLAHAQAHGMFEGLEVADLRGHLERWDIPVRTRCRVRGLGVTVGIHRDDLPAPATTSPGQPPQEDAEPQLHTP